MLSILFVSVIVGIVIYHNGQTSGENSKTPSLTPVPTTTPSPTPLPTATYSPPHETLTIIDSDYGMHGVLGIYDWNVTATVKNTGTTTVIITDIIVNGQPYSGLNPEPIVTPSIKNGYYLSPNQTVTITLVESNSQTQPFHNGGKIYLMTATGNSYLVYQSSG